MTKLEKLVFFVNELNNSRAKGEGLNYISVGMYLSDYKKNVFVVIVHNFNHEVVAGESGLTIEEASLKLCKRMGLEDDNDPNDGLRLKEAA